MPKINVYLPDDLAEAVKAGVPVSAICQATLEQAVRRLTTIRQLVASDLDKRHAGIQAPAFHRQGTDRVHAGGRAGTRGGRPPRRHRASAGRPARRGPQPRLASAACHRHRDQVRQGGLNRAAVGSAPGRTRCRTADQRTAWHRACLVPSPPANALGHNYIGCEHLLLGLISEPTAPPGRYCAASASMSGRRGGRSPPRWPGSSTGRRGRKAGARAPRPLAAGWPHRGPPHPGPR